MGACPGQGRCRRPKAFREESCRGQLPLDGNVAARRDRCRSTVLGSRRRAAGPRLLCRWHRCVDRLADTRVRGRAGGVRTCVCARARRPGDRWEGRGLGIDGRGVVISPPRRPAVARFLSLPRSPHADELRGAAFPRVMTPILRTRYAARPLPRARHPGRGLRRLLAGPALGAAGPDGRQAWNDGASPLPRVFAALLATPCRGPGAASRPRASRRCRRRRGLARPCLADTRVRRAAASRICRA